MQSFPQSLSETTLEAWGKLIVPDGANKNMSFEDIMTSHKAGSYRHRSMSSKWAMSLKKYIRCVDEAEQRAWDKKNKGKGDDDDEWKKTMTNTGEDDDGWEAVVTEAKGSSEKPDGKDDDVDRKGASITIHVPSGTHMNISVQCKRDHP